MPVYKAEGIVIRRANLGEADRLVTLFCLDHGKVTVAARGARKMKSRFVGRLELFSHVRALLAVGRTLDVVSQVGVAATFSMPRQNLDRLGYAAFAGVRPTGHGSPRGRWRLRGRSERPRTSSAASLTGLPDWTGTRGNGRR